MKIFDFMKNVKLSYRLAALSLGVGVATTVAVGVLSISQAGSALLNNEEVNLNGQVQARKAAVERYFDIINQQIINFATNRMIGEAT